MLKESKYNILNRGKILNVEQILGKSKSSKVFCLVMNKVNIST